MKFSFKIFIINFIIFVEMTKESKQESDYNAQNF